MYDIISYGWMIAFEQRTLAFARALEANITPGAVVLDIGCGQGIMSLIACRAGARKVYAIEPDDVIQVARDAVADNGFSERIEFIQAFSTEIDLPEKVDGVVADLRGIMPLEGQSIVSVVDARDRLLKPGGWIIPRRDTVWTALSCCPALHSSLINTWDTSFKFDFSQARAQCINSFRGTRLKPEDLITPAQQWAVLDYTQIDNPSVSGKMSWRIDRDATAHGVAAWYDCDTADGFSFSNSPKMSAPHVFRHAFFPWPEVLELKTDDRIEVTLRADYIHPDYVWSWNTLVKSGSGQERGRFNQSTFKGAQVSRDRLRKRERSFVPHPNDDLRVDRRALELMDRNLSLEDIAKALLAEFPTRLKDWNDALSRAGDLSEKYSR